MSEHEISWIMNKTSSCFVIILEQAMTLLSADVTHSNVTVVIKTLIQCIIVYVEQKKKQSKLYSIRCRSEAIVLVK